MEVAVHLKGDAPGVEKGGIIEQELRELEVQALPDKIPSMIEVDISGLDITQMDALWDEVWAARTALDAASVQSR